MDSRTFFWVLAIISGLSSFVPLSIGLINYKNIKGALVPLFILVLVSILIELLEYITSSANNLYFFHVFTIIEFTLISFYYHLFFKKHLGTYLALFIIPFFFIVAYFDLKINGSDSIDNFSSSIESLILSFYALISFFVIMKKMLFENLFSSSLFWINTAVLLYFSGNLLFFVFSNYLHTSEQDNYLAMWTMHSFLNIFYNILIGTGFWKAELV